MNPDQARNLVRQTLTQSFDKPRFRNFALELLNKFDESKAFTSNRVYIKDAFKNHVDRFERLGTYTSADNEKLDVLIVHLTKQSKLERARTAIRNFVADHLKQRDGKDAALVAFVSPTEQQWRFSYVKMEYATVEEESGKVGIKAHLTPARRFSYIVGEGESCHTAQMRFLDLLQDTDENPTLAQLEEAFSVEAVTKEFFKKYAELLGEIQKALERLTAKDKAIATEFEKKGVRTGDFAKKLMGQIVFLYFIQKKGWLGVAKGQDWGTGPHDFLRRLAKGDYGKYDNFFNDILERLFYDTLATHRGHEAWCKQFNCRIPFLNGGLFEPLADYDWRKTDIVLANRLFTNSERFDDFSTGTGILDMFDRYNFTVNEAEPLEKEVAIDPEMLGKVFENLIEENLRKGLGSYYTPREIVHYMCQESLINYLDTALNSATETIGREKRKQAKFGDEKAEQTLLTAPARNEIVPREDIETFVHLGDQISHYEAVETRYAIKMPKSIEKHARPIDEKLGDIRICDPAVGSGAFPVGMMSEIVRARSALTPYFNDIHDRTPYHFKRHAIQNCLYGVDIDPGAVEIAKLRLWLSLVVDEEDVKQIKPLPNLFYKIVTGNSLLGVEKTLFNQKLFQLLEELKPRYFDEPDKDKKDRYKQQIEDIIHELTNSKEAFDFEIYFSEVFHGKGGFDVVIANPPYVEFKNLSRDVKDSVNNYETVSGKYDLYVPFIERSYAIARPFGLVTLICPTRFMHREYGAALRRFLASHAQLLQVVDFADLQVFESATNYTGVFLFAKKRSTEYVFRYWRVSESLRPLELATERDGVVLVSDREVSEKPWYFGESTVKALTCKIAECGSPLRSLSVGIFQGISTGKDDVFVVSEAVVKEWNLESQSIQKMLKGKDVSRYRVDWGRKYVIYPYDESGQVIPEGSLRTKFPSTYHYLLSMRPKLKGRAYFDNSTKAWYELWNQRRLDRFHVPKIVTLDNAKRNSFCLDENNFVGTTTVYSIVLRKHSSDHLLFVLGVLNSSVVEFYHKHNTIPQAGGFYRYQASLIENIPVATGNNPQQKRIIDLVERILAAKQRNGEADTSVLEREIDKLVYALYSLTPDEIKIVEGASSAKGETVR